MRLYKILLSILIFMISAVPVKAEDEYYHIYDFKNDGSEEELDYFSSYNKAYSFFKKELGEHDNVGIVYNDKIIELEMGVASLKNDDCTQNIDFTDINGRKGYINGCYIGDLAYIKTNKRAESVRLKGAGVTADFDMDDVTLYPLNQLNYRLSSYTVIDDVLYHQIKTSMNTDMYSAMLKIGKAPEYLKNDIYYSYDGHYFYSDYQLMIEDYRNGTFINSLNPEEPYYSYYMYLPQRTYTEYTVEDIDNYLKNNLLIDSKIDYYYDLNRDYTNDILNTSQLYGEIKSFFRYEYLYGANALMMLSLSFNESGYGRSRFAYNRNNLFGHSAYDNDIEKNASRYLTIDASVLSHAKYYISGNYGNAVKYSYTGSYFGDKESGMNINYASDPYWGEKAAHYTYTIDEALGLKDYESYTIGIVKNCDKLNIYKDRELKNISYTVDKYNNYALVILEELDDAYKVALEIPNDNKTYTYDFKTSYGYVLKENVDYLIGKSLKNTEYKTIIYEGNGGLYDEDEAMTVTVDINHTEPLFEPLKEGFEFSGYDIETKDDSIVYKANYKEIESLELINLDSKEVELNWYLDLRDCYLKVNYKGLGSEKLPVTSDMIRGFDLSSVGTYDAEVCYSGLSVPFSVKVTTDDDLIRSDISKILDKEYITLADAYKVKDYAKEIDGSYSMNQIRKLDSLILEDQKDNITYTIAKNSYNLGVSGLALSIPFSNLSSAANPFKETVEVKMSEIDKKSEERLNRLAEAYGYVPIDAFKLEVIQNIDKAILNTPLVFSVSHKDYDSSQIYMVYMENEDQDLVKLNTSVSDGSIEFMTPSCGSFVICYKKTNNEFERHQLIENTNEENSALSFAEYFLKISLGLASATIVAMAIIVILKKRKPNGRKTTKNNRSSGYMFKKKS